MSFADRHGAETTPTGPIVLTSEAMALARDITVVRMRARRVPWRRIAEYLNTPAMTLKSRYDRMDPEVRSYYEETPLEMFGI